VDDSAHPKDVGSSLEHEHERLTTVAPAPKKDQVWVVTGGVDTGGILVRTGKDVDSSPASQRLETGSKLQQLERQGPRLRYKLLSGKGPDSGWVSIKISSSGAVLVKKIIKKAPHAVVKSPFALKIEAFRAAEKLKMKSVMSKLDSGLAAWQDLKAPQEGFCEWSGRSGGTLTSETVKRGYMPTIEQAKERAPDSPRILWTYWDQGADYMPSFNKLCVATWRYSNPSWSVKVVDRDSLKNFVEPEDLPKTFTKMKYPQHRADCAKTALLLRHGGIYMDSSTIVWHDLLEFSGWEQIEQGVIDFIGYYKGALQYVENFFLACRRDCPLLHAWHHAHLHFWSTRTEVGFPELDPFFRRVDLSHIAPLDRGYLVQHACYKKLWDRSDYFRELAKRSILHDAAAPTGALWLSRRLLRDAEGRVRQQDAFEALKDKSKPKSTPLGSEDAGRSSMQSALVYSLLGSIDSELLLDLEQRGTPLAKITGHMNHFLAQSSMNELTSFPSTTQRLLQRALPRKKAPQCFDPAGLSLHGQCN